MADTGTHAKRKLQQQEENGGRAGGGADEEKDSISTMFQKGAGTCSYKNPFTQFDTCVQMTGSAWEDTEQAAGVCVNNDGKEDETTSAFVLVPDNLLASCDLTISGCETFGGGVWYRAGGQCSKDETSEASTSIIDVPAGSNVTLAEGVCKLQLVLFHAKEMAGGHHDDYDAEANENCWARVVRRGKQQEEGRLLPGRRGAQHLPEGAQQHLSPLWTHILHDRVEGGREPFLYYCQFTRGHSETELDHR